MVSDGMAGIQLFIGHS